MIFEKIEKLAKQRKISLAKLMRGVDISEGSYYNMRNRNDITVETLKKFEAFFSVPITYFFVPDDSPLPLSGVQDKVEVGEKARDLPVEVGKVDYATQLIARLENDLKKAEEREAYLMRQNQVLMEK